MQDWKWSLVTSQGRYVGDSVVDWRHAKNSTLAFIGGQATVNGTTRFDLLTLPTETSDESISHVESSHVSPLHLCFS
jgi:hypothetical protein